MDKVQDDQSPVVTIDLLLQLKSNAGGNKSQSLTAPGRGSDVASPRQQTDVGTPSGRPGDRSPPRQVAEACSAHGCRHVASVSVAFFVNNVLPPRGLLPPTGRGVELHIPDSNSGGRVYHMTLLLLLFFTRKLFLINR